MSDPKAAASLWGALIDMNRVADGLIARVQKAIDRTQPISREIPFFASIEARFDHLPLTYATVPAVNSDATAGNNIKRPVFTNGSSRVYVRELSFQSFSVKTITPPIPAAPYDSRIANDFTAFPFNWRWNFKTSITEKQYSANRRVLASAGGRALAGNHLCFREPLIIEPMETFIFECELLGGFGMQLAAVNMQGTSAVVAMLLSGYREGT